MAPSGPSPRAPREAELLGPAVPGAAGRGEAARGEQMLAPLDEFLHGSFAASSAGRLGGHARRTGGSRRPRRGMMATTATASTPPSRVCPLASTEVTSA